MSRIDDTRENIKTGKMSDDERKEMFKKFVDHGGEVINERPRKNRQFDREKQRNYVQRLDQHQEALRKKAKNQQKKRGGGQFSQHSGGAEQVKRRNPFIQYLHLIRIRFNLLLRGVTDSSGQHINVKFIQRFNSEYKSAVMFLQTLYIEIFKSIDYNKAERIIDRLDALKPLYFELIEMGADIYDSELTGQIVDEYIVFDQKTFLTAQLEGPLKEYFKRIYLLYNYQTSLMTAYEKAFSLYGRVKKEGFNPNEYKRKTKNTIYVVFNKFFPQLYWLFCYYDRWVTPLFDYISLEEMLDITPEMKPGNRVANSPSRLQSDFAVKTRQEREKEEEEQMEEAREEIKKKSAPVVSEEVKRGLELMSTIPYDDFAEKFLKNTRYRMDYDQNPLVKAYLVFQEFDEEYSIIFTTNKVKINVPSDRRSEVDYRLKLSELYNQIRHIDEDFKSYFDLLERYTEAENDKPHAQSQYFNYSKRLTEIERQITTTEGGIRTRMRNFFVSIVDALEVLAKDMEGQQKIVQNPQELIEFDYELEGHKKLKGKKIYQAILEVVDYASAFIHRLSGNNDLSNSGSAVKLNSDTFIEDQSGARESDDHFINEEGPEPEESNN